ncbi:MAG: hypothetical protein IIY52_07305 [Solobacterium sp.]|nr:hypothetical protein [Solobacterium sp.]
MNKYTLLYRAEKWMRRTAEQGYLKEGYEVCFKDEDTLLMVLHTAPVDEETERKMLQVILSAFRRSGSAGNAVLDLSDLMNRHIGRLTENQCSSLKFHDPFLDELKQLQIRQLIHY